MSFKPGTAQIRVVVHEHNAKFWVGAEYTAIEAAEYDMSEALLYFPLAWRAGHTVYLRFFDTYAEADWAARESLSQVLLERSASNEPTTAGEN